MFSKYSKWKVVTKPTTKTWVKKEMTRTDQIQHFALVHSIFGQGHYSFT
jgi:hypothetical protein